MSKQNQVEIILIITSADGSEREVIVNHADDNRLKLSAGETYRFLQRIDSTTLPLEQVIGSRIGHDLNLLFTEDESMALQDYFTLCTEGECVVEIALENTTDGELSYFSLAADSLGLELGDGSQLMLAHGDMHTLMELAQGQSALSHAIQQAQGSQLGLGDVLAEAEVTSEETAATASITSSFVGLTTLVGFGMITAEVLRNSNDSNDSSDVTEVVVSGVLAAGPMIENTGLSIEVYGTDGTQLTTVLMNDDGTYEFTLSADYSGAVLLRTVDANGSLPDYIDETSKLPVDLTADLRSIIFISGDTSTYVANINPVTELLVRKLGMNGGDDGDSESTPAELSADQIVVANTEVANALGLTGTDLVSDTPKLKVDVAGVDQADVDDYGNILAAISGSESVNGETTDEILTDLANEISSDGALSTEAKTELVAGISAADGDVEEFAANIAFSAPIINGAFIEGELLEMDSSLISDADGGIAFGYQWFADGVEINGAVQASYILTQSEVGKAITMTVNYVDDLGAQESVTSAMSTPVTNINDVPEGNVVITGGSRVGDTLTADTSKVTDTDGIGEFTYQWQDAGINIDGATSETYLLEADKAGTTIRVIVSYTDDGGEVESLTSSETPEVSGAGNNLPVGLVTITGSAEEGSTLTADTGAISDVDGIGVFNYQWRADGTDILGATGATFNITAAQVGVAIDVVVTYSDGAGNSERVISDATADVANVNDVPTGGVTITGSVVINQELGTDITTLADIDGLGTLVYQWFANGEAIINADKSTYNLTQAEAGKVITVELSYVDGNGSNESVISNASVPVVDNAPEVVDPSLFISQGETVVLTAAGLGVSDDDSSAEEVIIEVNFLTYGSLTKNEFNLSELNNGDISFTHDGSDNPPAFSIKVTDSTNTTASYFSVDITFDLPAVADAPTISGAEFNIQQGQELVISREALGVIDLDSNDADVQVNINSVNRGFFALVADTTASISSFTLADVAAGNVLFIHDDSELTPEANISSNNTGSVPLPGSSVDVVFNYTNVDDPVVISSPQISITQGDSLTITTEQLGISDIDSDSSVVVIRVTEITGGQFLKVGSATAITEFTLEEVNASEISFQHDNTVNAPVFNISASDATSSTDSVAVQVIFDSTLSDDAPIVILPNLTINEGETITLSVSDLGVIDNDTAASDVSIQLSNISAGYFQLSETSFNGDVIFSLQDVIDGEIRFIHDGSENPPEFSVAAKDETSDYSVAIDATVTYSANVNDVPTIGNPVIAINEGESKVLTLTDLDISDEDSSLGDVLVEVLDLQNASLVNRDDANIVITRFTLEEVDEGRILLIADGSDNPPYFALRVKDETSSYSVASDATIDFSNTEDDAPVIAQPSLSVNQGETIIISVADLSLTDDSDSADVIITVSNVTAGGFQVSGVEVTEFTLEQVESGMVSFEHDGTTTAPAFSVAAADVNNTVSVGVSALITFISDADDAPVVGTPRLTINEGETVAITEADIAISDEDSSDADIKIFISDLDNGAFRLNGSEVTEFTRAD
ncbi:MAG: cadherin-like domain-containing protein, partial [Gammaproteobacteria bacterium]|nr:cadherin-like domain-containing protein [Gammaproteobacteria bacterium]